MDPFVAWKINRYAGVATDDVTINLERAINSVIRPFVGPEGAPVSENKPAKQKGESKTNSSEDWSNIDDEQVSGLVKNAEIAKASQPQVYQFVKLVAWVLKNFFPGKTMEITNAKRTPEKQVQLMKSNWEKHGGNAKLESPKTIKVNNVNKTVDTKGTLYLLGLYKNKAMAYSFGKELESGNFDDAKWIRFFKKYPLQHGRGAALDFSIKNKPWAGNVIDKAGEYSNIKKVNESDHIHVGIIAVSRPTNERYSSKKKIPLIKTALQIAIEPYNSIVMDAVREIEERQPGYFNDVDKIVIEPGAPSHFGMVKSDEPKTIFVSLDKIKAAINQDDPDRMLAALREVLSHEMGHLKSKFQGGEAPAESESRRMEQMFSVSDQDLDLMITVAHSLDKAGLRKEADIVDASIRKEAVVTQVSNPLELSQTILRILYHFVQKVKPENQNKYIQSLRNRLLRVNPLELSEKAPNPGAGVGASLSIVKNILGGHNQQEVSETMRLVFNGLSKF